MTPTSGPTAGASSAKSKTYALPKDLRPGWRKIAEAESTRPYFRELVDFLESERSSGASVFPASENVFRVFREIDLEEVRVVILGQDPYHGEGQAIGRSFAVPDALSPKPPSLQNIFKELATDLGVAYDRASRASELDGWSEQGVLLLNTVLTVRSGEAFSHRKRGWEGFTDRVIRALDARERPIVFVLWGSAAIAKKSMLDLSRHVVIESPHPSPLSAHRGFFGSKPFSRANAALEKLGERPIDWARR